MFDVYMNLYDKPDMTDESLIEFLKNSKDIILQEHVINGEQGSTPAKFIDKYVNSKRSLLKQTNKGVYFEPYIKQYIDTCIRLFIL
jgi:hypothetical protein